MVTVLTSRGTTTLSPGSSSMLQIFPLPHSRSEPETGMAVTQSVGLIGRGGRTMAVPFCEISEDSPAATVLE